MMRQGFQQAPIPAVDLEASARFTAIFEQNFSAALVEPFLMKVQKAGLTLRNLDQILAKGILGKGVEEDWNRLPVSDRALLREMYLRLVEGVLPEVRQRFYKVYASY